MCMFIPVWIGIENHQQIKMWVENQMQAKEMNVIIEIYRQDYMKDIGK